MVAESSMDSKLSFDTASTHSAVMPAHSRPKDGVASLAYVAGIHALAAK
jgi:hypothetical protein